MYDPRLSLSPVLVPPHPVTIDAVDIGACTYGVVDKIQPYRDRGSRRVVRTPTVSRLGGV